MAIICISSTKDYSALPLKKKDNNEVSPVALFNHIQEKKNQTKWVQSRVIRVSSSVYFITENWRHLPCSIQEENERARAKCLLSESTESYRIGQIPGRKISCWFPSNSSGGEQRVL